MINNRKVIEIKGVGFINKGAQLMLYSILEELKSRYPTAIIAIQVDHRSTYQERTACNIYQKLRTCRYAKKNILFSKFISTEIKFQFGIVEEKDIDIVLDASGFAYTSQFGELKTSRLLKDSKYYKKNGIKNILLPQAYGPFDTKKIISNMQSALKYIDLTFARDKISFQHLNEITTDKEEVYLAPDFTNIINGRIPINLQKYEDKVCIIPNSQMLDKLEKFQGIKYIELMKNIINHLDQNNIGYYFLLHESITDEDVVNKILENEKFNHEVVLLSDPLEIKGLIGISKGIIGSRYHGLINGLSQGLPCIGVGWSHKYQELFNDYKIPNALINLDDSSEKIYEIMEIIINNEKRKEMMSKLAFESGMLKSKTKEMWKMVHQVINS